MSNYYPLHKQVKAAKQLIEQDRVGHSVVLMTLKPVVGGRENGDQVVSCINSKEEYDLHESLAVEGMFCILWTKEEGYTSFGSSFLS